MALLAVAYHGGGRTLPRLFSCVQRRAVRRMSLNTSHTPDGQGVLIYNGELILLYISDVRMSFTSHHPVLHGKKSGSLYLSTHRIIFMCSEKRSDLRSFSMPFHMLRDVKLEQPVLMPNYLKGDVHALQDGGFEGAVQWKLSFPKGGCIDFGRALLKAADMASNARPAHAPPAYGMFMTTMTYYSAPQTYYMAQGGAYQGFQAPVNVFPEQPPAGNVYMYDAPPPYAGIGGPATPYPVAQLQYAGQQPPVYPGQQPQPGMPQMPQISQPNAPPSYEAAQSSATYNGQAPPLPDKTPIN